MECGKSWSVAAAWACVAAIAAAGEPPIRPLVEVEQDLYRYQPAGNGAGPMWCAGSTTLVRIGGDVYATGLETIPGVRPLNNCRWRLWRLHEGSWQPSYIDDKGRTREPSPVVCFPGGPLFVSANPTLTAPNTYSGPARPELFEFGARSNGAAPRKIIPQWFGEPAFTEHSYRSFVADGQRRELLLIQNVGYTHAEWTFRDSRGKWAAAGKLVWPYGGEYDRPQPIRVCYPAVMLKDRAVYFCGVSDIMEPNTKWRKFKKELTGRDWDYDFRRLFFTWSDDITTGRFHSWVEIASRDATGGHIFPCDLWVDGGNRVHLLWTERALDERLREKFFPEARQSHALNYAVVEQGKVTHRLALVRSEEGQPGVSATAARFHVTPDGRLWVFYYARGTGEGGRTVSENRLVPILVDGAAGEAVVVPLKHPLIRFFTATVRAGCRPSEYLDLLGTRVGSKNTISYARVRLETGAR